MKEKDQVRMVGKPEFYSILYIDIKKAALELGYALAMHGSMHRDMDLIAVAWVEDARPAGELVAAINKCLGNTVWSEHNLKNAEHKPHGRICYTLSIGSDWFIDLSIIPPKKYDYAYKNSNSLPYSLPLGNMAGTSCDLSEKSQPSELSHLE